MATKKVVLNGQTLIDLTLDTVEPEYVVQGKTFHGRDGVVYSGTYKPNIQALTITENGIYPIDDLVDGYGPITVEVTAGSVDPSMKPTLLPPTIEIDQATATLTITDTRNDNHTEEYDIYFNGGYFMTVHQHIIKLLAYAEIIDTTQVTVTAKSSCFNTSVKSNTVLWRKYTSTPSSSGSALYTPSIVVNGAAKTIVILSDSNSSSYTEGYRIFCNDEEIFTIPFADRQKIIDISEYVDETITQVFKAQAYRKTTQTSYSRDSAFSAEKILILPYEGTLGLNYTLTSSTVDPYYTCTGKGSATTTDIVVPPYYQNVPVRYVQGFASTNITSISLPEGMLTINGSTFQNCTSLVEVTLPGTITSIGEYSFDQCNQLQYIFLPKDLKYIYSYAFRNCTSLLEVDFGQNINRVSLERYAFSGCSKLEKFNLKEASIYGNNRYIFQSCSKINLYFTSLKALCNCTYSYEDSTPFYYRTACKIYLNGEILTNIDLSEDITSIGSRTFYYCSHIESITLNNVTTIGAYAFCYSSIKSVFTSDKLTTISDGAFSNCTQLTFFDFKNGLTSINNYAFTGCSKLNFSSLPNTLLTIGSQAFNGCIGLTEINLPNSIRTLSDQAFQGCTKITSINIPVLITTLGSVFQNCTSLTSIEIPWGTTSLTSTFYGCTNLEEVTLHDNIVTLGGSTFYNCVKLKQFALPKQLVTIGGSCFYKCALFEEIIIPDGVNSVGANAFQDCANLMTLHIGRSVLSIGDQFIRNDKNLTNFTIDPSNIAYDLIDGVLYTKDKKTILVAAPMVPIETLILEEGVETIKSYAFEYSKTKQIVPQTGLKTIQSYAFHYAEVENFDFVSTIETIGDYGFAYCKKLSSAILPDTLKSIGSYSFYYNESLTSAYLGNIITSIPSYCFAYCTSLATIVFPRNLQTINSYVFYHCENLNGLNFPETLTTINSYAFSYCLNLGNIYCPSALVTLSSNAFYYSVLEDFYADSLTSIGSYAFSYCVANIIDIRDCQITALNDRMFESATIDTLFIPKTVTLLYGYVFNSLKVNNLYILGTKPKPNNSNDPWNNLQAKNLYIVDFDSWMQSYSYESGLLTIPNRYLIDENFNYVNSATITTYSWDASRTKNFKNITHVYIENSSGYYINSESFAGWTSLEYIYYNMPLAYNTSWGSSYYQWLVNIGTTAKIKVELGPAVKGIPQYFFYNSTALKEIDFSQASSCVSINSQGIYSCSYLQKITLNEGMTTLYSNAITQCMRLQEIVMPSTLTSLQNYALAYNSSLKSIDLSNVTTLSGYTLYQCFGLESIKLPKNISTLPTQMCYQCYNLSQVEFGGNALTTISTYCFYQCYSLQSIKIPNSVITIDNYAFCDSGLISVELGTGVKNIYNYAFSNCYKLYEVYNNSTLNLQKQNSSYGYVSYYAKKILTAEEESIYTIDNGLILYFNENNSYTIMGCQRSVQNLFIPEIINDLPCTISNYAFAGNSQLLSVDFAPNITTIPTGCFWGCKGLKEITIPEQIVTIGNYAFSYLYNLETLYVKAKAYIKSASGLFSYAGMLSENLKCIVKQGTTALSGLFYNGNTVYLKELHFEDLSSCQTFSNNCFANCASDLKIYINDLANWITISFSNGQSNPLYSSNSTLYVNGEKFTEFTWPHNNTTIKPYVFYNCSQLTKLTLGDDVESIGAYSFYQNSNLAQVSIGANVTTLGNYAFAECRKLTLCEYSAKNINSTNSYCFAYAGANVTFNVIIHSSVESIPDNLFNQSCYISNIEFKENKNNLNIGSNAFSQSGRTISKVEIASLIDWLSFRFSASTSNPLSKGTAGLYINGELLKICVVPTSIKQLSPYVFYRYKELTEAYLHAEVEEIGVQAFIGIPNLAIFSFPEENTNFIKEESIVYSADKTQIIAIENVGNIEHVDFPETLQAIPPYLFYNHKNLQHVELPDQITSIGEYAFYYCENLDYINIPESLTSLGRYAFYYCARVQSIDYNAINLTSVPSESYTFQYLGYNNSSDTTLTLTIGPNVKQLPSYLFYGDGTYYPRIKKITHNNNSVCTSIGYASLYYLRAVKEIELPDSVQTIGDYGLYYMSSVKDFVFPSSLKTIGSHSFYHWQELEEITLPTSLTTINDYAFSYCYKAETITIPISVTSIFNYIFTECGRLQIFCEAESKPSGWSSQWNHNGRPVYWNYDEIQFTYEFDTNTDIIIEPVTSNLSITLPNLVAEDKFFWGWYLEEDFSGELYLPGQKIYGGDLTSTKFFARWEDTSIGSGNNFAEARPINVFTEVTVNSINSSPTYYYFIPKTSRTYYFQTTNSNVSLSVYIYYSNQNYYTGFSGINVTGGVSLTANSQYYIKIYPSSSGQNVTHNFYLG